MSIDNPQLADGYTPIANAIMDALARTRFSGYERSVLDFLFRKTYGWAKKSDLISLSQFVDGTGILKPHVARTIKRLVERKVITRNGNDTLVRYEFNKHYGEWIPLPKLVTLPKMVIQPLPKMVPTISIEDTKAKGLLPPTPKIRTAKISFDKQTGQFIGLSEDLQLKLKTAYPDVDLPQVIREAQLWAVDNHRQDYWGSLKAFCKHSNKGGTNGTDRKRGYRPSIEDAVFTGEDCIGNSHS